MIRLEWLFFTQLLLGIFMVILLQKLTQMKKQVDEIVREVNAYITYITENVDEGTRSEKMKEKKHKEELQNQLIQSVLGEFFP